VSSILIFGEEAVCRAERTSFRIWVTFLAIGQVLHQFCALHSPVAEWAFDDFERRVVFVALDHPSPITPSAQMAINNKW